VVKLEVLIGLEQFFFCLTSNSWSNRVTISLSLWRCCFTFFFCILFCNMFANV